MFEKFILDIQHNIFDQLASASQFEDVNSGRTGTTLIDYQEGIIPLVRTTTKYTKPNQSFSPIHYDLIEKIKLASNKQVTFNNALAEIYTDDYRSMGYHSDQALDLASDSYICVFSCYDNPTDLVRKLIIKNKITDKSSEISLDHNSIVLFSTSTNREHLHKIVLDVQELSRSVSKSTVNQPQSSKRVSKSTHKSQKNISTSTQTKWLGITFRLSKTFIKFDDKNQPYFYPRKDRPLRLATNDEQREFYKNRSKENMEIAFEYPETDYTISVGDMMCP
jgi:hypothetical protein